MTESRNENPNLRSETCEYDPVLDLRGLSAETLMEKDKMQSAPFNLEFFAVQQQIDTVMTDVEDVLAIIDSSIRMLERELPNDLDIFYLRNDLDRIKSGLGLASYNQKTLDSTISYAGVAIKNIQKNISYFQKKCSRTTDKFQFEKYSLIIELLNVLISTLSKPSRIKNKTDVSRVDFNLFEFKLSEMEKTYPNDKDLKRTRMYYDDIKSDLEAKKMPVLDDSLNNMTLEIQEELDKAGFVKEQPLESSQAGLVAKLEALGIHPDYVVSSGKPGAKTIILLAQMHPIEDDKLSKTLSADSQSRIEKIINSLFRSKVTPLVFMEGVPIGEIDQNLLFQDSNNSMAVYRLKKQLGSQIIINGIEDNKFLYRPESLSNYMEHRVGFNNIILAENISSQLATSKESIATLTLGRAHEYKHFTDWLNAYFIPISKLLALYGMNVIVVDTDSSSSVK